MEIHFVCLGNTYRSRLAEAYFNSFALRGVHAVSSGIQGGDQSVPIRWYTEKILEENGLVEYTHSIARQTTRQNIRRSDFLVFFGHETFAFCKQWIDPERHRWAIWNVPDISVVRPASRVIKNSQQAFRSIKHRVDQLKKTYAVS